MRRVLHIYILILTLLISSCSKEEYVSSPRDNMGEVEQVTIMYFMGTHLSYFYNYNISDIAAAVKSGALGDEGRVFIFMPSTSYAATLYEIYEEDGSYKTETVATYSDDIPYLSADMSRMSEVINKTISFASAKKYNLVISGHGSGWVPYSAGYISSTSPISTNNIFDKDPNALPTRYIGVSSDGIMEISELKEALEATSTKFGYILFDMCLMSNIETLYDLRGMCDNIVASPAEVMGAGFPYKTVLPYLFTDNGSSYDLESVCEAYYTSCVSSSYATVAWCVSSELDALAAKILAMNEGGYIEYVNISSLQCYERLSSHIFCDLWHYICEACTDETLLAQAEEIFDRAFPPAARYHTTYAYSGLTGSSGSFLIDDDNYSGVSTSAPSSTTKSNWEQTSWAQATQAME